MIKYHVEYKEWMGWRVAFRNARHNSLYIYYDYLNFNLNEYDYKLIAAPTLYGVANDSY